MKIEKIEFIPIRVAKRIVAKGGQWKTALGNHSVGDAVIVVMHTDEGITGLGEVSSIWDTFASGLVAGFGAKIGDAVIGLDVFAIGDALERMDKAVAWCKNANCLKAGIEMAMYDIIGKISQLPVYQLLGGKRRDRIELSHSIAMGTIEERLEQIAVHYAEGFRTVKIKVGIDFPSDLQAIRAARKKYNDSIQIRVDANMGWRDEKTLQNLTKELADLGVISIEQPFAPYELEKLARLTAASPVPIMLDESIWGPEDAIAAIRAGAGNIFNTYVSESGGLQRSMLISQMCDLAGIGFCIGSMPEFGIGTAAELHLGLAAAHIDHPSDVIGNLYFDDDIIAETLPVKEGFAYSIDSPGLGVSLDWDKIEKYRTDKS